MLHPEPIPHPRLGVDVGWPRRVRFKFGAQVTDVDTQGVHVVVAFTPYLAEYLTVS